MHTADPDYSSVIRKQARLRQNDDRIHISVTGLTFIIDASLHLAKNLSSCLSLRSAFETSHATFALCLTSRSLSTVVL